MDARLADFAGLLRVNGVRVSPAEVGDAVAAAALVGLDDRSGLRAALRTTLVKRAADVPVFDGLFEYYFSGAGRLGEAAERGILAALEEEGLLDGEELERLAAALQALSPGLSPLARAALEGGALRLSRLLQGAVLQIDVAGATSGAAGFVARRLLAAAGGAALPAELERLLAAARERGLSPDGLRLLSVRLEAALRGVEEAARAVAEGRLQAATLRRREEERRQGLSAVTPEEAMRVEAAVRRLAERLREPAGARSAPAGAAPLDGAPDAAPEPGLGRRSGPPRLPRPPPRTGRTWWCSATCPSRSATSPGSCCSSCTRCRRSSRRVRSFVFVSDLGEVTEAFAPSATWPRAADLAAAARAVSLARNSNYGRALVTFHRRFAGAVTWRTTVLVIGDGRNNYTGPGGVGARGAPPPRSPGAVDVPRGAAGPGAAGTARCPSTPPRSIGWPRSPRLADLDGLADALVPR